MMKLRANVILCASCPGFNGSTGLNGEGWPPMRVIDVREAIQKRQLGGCQMTSKRRSIGSVGPSLCGFWSMAAVLLFLASPALSAQDSDEGIRALAQGGAASANIATGAMSGRPQIPAMFDGDDFIEIIRRDEGLETRPTGYAPNDAEPDAEFTITLSEGKAAIGQGVIYDGFVTNDSIPGPTIRVTEGDVVRINVKNEGDVMHGASIHAAYTQTSKHVGMVMPGETKSVTFRATTPGVYMYHCAPGGHAIPMHVMFGQYGMIVVEPKEKKYKLEEDLGHEPDLKLYLIQHELYASGKEATEADFTYSMWNGGLFRYVEEPIMVEPGDYVRVYFLNVGPNRLSTFHLVGIIWDYVYWQGHPEARMPGGQTVTAGPSDSWVIEFRIPPEEGTYTMVDHTLAHSNRGAIGLMVAEKGARGPSEVLAEGPLYSKEELDEKIANARRVIQPFGIPDEATNPTPAPADRPVRFGDDVEEVIIEIKGNSYSPKIVEVAPGTKITFVNEELFTYGEGETSGAHNAVVMNGPDFFATGMLAHAESETVTVNEPGVYDYICTPHPYMEGRIIVRDPNN